MTKLTAAEQEAKKAVNAFQLGIDFSSLDSICEEAAARNLVAGKPAFGWTSMASNQAAGHFINAVNEHASVEAGQADVKPWFDRRGWDAGAEEWLHRLIPLNHAAVMDLMRAYQNVGTWRTPAELRERATRRGWEFIRQPSSTPADALEGVSLVAAE